jgi:hypothetical protein
MRTWSVDSADVTPTEAGFDWLPGSHIVCVRFFEDAREAIGPVRYRITITTDFLRSMPVHDPAFVARADIFAHALCPTYSPVYPPSEVVKRYFKGKPADLQLFGSAYIDEITAPWLTGFLARMSILQPIFAEHVSESMQQQFGSGTPAFAGSSKRANPHGVLNVDDDIRLAGVAPSIWAGSGEFEDFAEVHARNDMCFGSGDGNSLTLETPFGADSALILFRTDELYPPLGNGLVVETRIRQSNDPDGICDKAAWLNFFESVQWTDFPQLGRWHLHQVSQDHAFLAHTCFVPNVFFVEGLVENYGLWATDRAQWARRILLPDTRN